MYVKIRTTKQFKYLREIISGNGSDNAVMENKNKKIRKTKFGYVKCIREKQTLCKRQTKTL